MVTSYTHPRTQTSTSFYKLINAADEKRKSKQRWFLYKLIIKVACKPVILGSILSTHNFFIGKCANRQRQANLDAPFIPYLFICENASRN
jgi:hypothetical protein